MTDKEKIETLEKQIEVWKDLADKWRRKYYDEMERQHKMVTP